MKKLTTEDKEKHQVKKVTNQKLLGTSIVVIKARLKSKKITLIIFKSAIIKKKSLNKILKPINPKMMILIMALMKMKYNEHLFIKVN